MSQPPDTPPGLAEEPGPFEIDPARVAAMRAALKAAVDEGLAQLDRGEGIPAREFLAMLRKRHGEQIDQLSPADRQVHD